MQESLASDLGFELQLLSLLVKRRVGLVFIADLAHAGVECGFSHQLPLEVYVLSQVVIAELCANGFFNFVLVLLRALSPAEQPFLILLLDELLQKLLDVQLHFRYDVFFHHFKLFEVNQLLPHRLLVLLLHHKQVFAWNLGAGHGEFGHPFLIQVLDPPREAEFDQVVVDLHLVCVHDGLVDILLEFFLMSMVLA